MPVKTLMDLAMATIFKNIKELTNAGDFLPYETLRPILLKVDSARQLRQIEMNSPQIEGETGEIWLKLIEKDFPMEFRAQLFKPPDPSKWYKVYERYKKIHDRALQESEAKLKQAFDGLEEDRAKNTSKIVNKKLPSRVVKRRGGPRDSTVSAMTFNRGTRTKTLTGAGVMRKVRRETKEIANIHGSLSRAITNPSRAPGTTQLRQAPAAMVDDYKRAAKPVYRTTAKQPLEKPAFVQDHEARATYISDYGSDDDFDDDDDPFDASAPTAGGFIKPKPKSTPVPASSANTKNSAPRPGALPPRPSSALLSAQKGKGLLSRGPSKNAVIIKPSPTASKPADETRKRPRSPDLDSPRTKPSSIQNSRSTEELPRKSAAIRARDEVDRPRPSSPPNVSPAPNPAIRKRKPVDVFMRSNKRAR